MAPLGLTLHERGFFVCFAAKVNEVKAACLLLTNPKTLLRLGDQLRIVGCSRWAIGKLYPKHCVKKPTLVTATIALLIAGCVQAQTPADAIALQQQGKLAEAVAACALVCADSRRVSPLVSVQSDP